MNYHASHRHAPMSPRKIRPIATLIRGKMADEALEVLRFLPNRGARFLEKVIQSALGNAEDRRAPNLEELFILEARVDGGPMMKRIQPRARGSAYPIKKWSSHIRIVLSDGDDIIAPGTEPTPAAPARR